MSVVSDFHDIVIYNGKNKPLDGQRLCVITFKTEKKKSEKLIDGKENPLYDPNYKRPEARCISIPQLNVRCEPVIIQNAMQAAFEDLQDALIRKKLLEKLEAGETVINFHKDQIGFDEIALYAAEVAASGKLTKEMIIDWFDNDVADALTLKIANAMNLSQTPSSDEEKKLAAAVTNYRSIFATLAAPRAGLSKHIAGQLQKALACVESKDERVYRTLELKIKSNLEEKEPDLVGL